MSISGGADELHRAVISEQLNTGGVTEDVQQFTATEDRELVKAYVSANGTQGFVELSFSSNSNLSNQDQDDTKAQTFYMGHDGTVSDLGIHWDAGEEVHIHERNNTGAAIPYTVVIYYREL